MTVIDHEYFGDLADRAEHTASADRDAAKARAQLDNPPSGKRPPGRRG